MDKQELKPCPFCGGEAKLISYQPYDGYQGESEWHFVKCKKCGMRTSESTSKAKMMIQWNRNHDIRTLISSTVTPLVWPEWERVRRYNTTDDYMFVIDSRLGLSKIMAYIEIGSTGEVKCQEMFEYSKEGYLEAQAWIHQQRINLILELMGVE